MLQLWYNTQSSAPEDGRNNRPKLVELIGIINQPLLLHLVGCLYYLLRQPLAVLSFMNIGTMKAMFYLRAKMKFFLYFPYYSPDLAEIQNTSSPYSTVKH